MFYRQDAKNAMLNQRKLKGIFTTEDTESTEPQKAEFETHLNAFVFTLSSLRPCGRDALFLP
jgi:hypothetical protein